MRLQVLHPELHLRFVTTDSFPLTGNSSIRLIINALHLIISPGEMLYEHGYRMEMATREKLSLQQIEEKLGELYSAAHSLIYKPFYEIVDKVIRLLDIESETDQIYILSFLQHVHDFVQTRTATLRLFLMWWDDEQERLYLQSAETPDAIRIMTIHQSKGLEYPAILIPFCNWPFEPPPQRAPLLWCNTTRPPFDAMAASAIKYAQAINETWFAEDYIREKANQYIDNLNLLYVATTRARLAIGIRASMPKTNKNGETSIRTVGDLLYQVAENSIPWLEEKTAYPGIVQKEYGSLPRQTETKPIAGKRPEEYSNFLPGRREPLSLRIKYTLTDKDISTWHDTRFGNTMHALLEVVDMETNPPEAAVDMAIASGNIPEGERSEFIRGLLQVVNHSFFEGWFIRAANVLPEKRILLPLAGYQRPDRVRTEGDHITIVDFKFGSPQPAKHRGQLSAYKEALLAMGYQEAEAFLYYFITNELVRIE